MNGEMGCEGLEKDKGEWIFIWMEEMRGVFEIYLIANNIDRIFFI